MMKGPGLICFACLMTTIFSSCLIHRDKEQVIREMKNDLYYLANDQLEGREAGTPGELWASKYLANRFMQLNLKPMGTKGFIEPFVFKNLPHHGDTSVMLSGVTARNVIGYMENKADNTIIIGAHYDHLGYGGPGSLYRGSPAIHNGADDNASGVTAMLALAERLKRRNCHNNYLFIAFSGEEKGLFGSNYYVKNPMIDLKKVNFMINMDMVGRMRDSSMIVYGTGTSPAWNDVLDGIQMKFLKIKKEESGIGPSDHTSFYLQDIPVLHFFTGQHEDYHKPTDDADKINFDGMYNIVAFIDSVITRLDTTGKQVFTETKDQDSRKTPKFSVTLGIIPDYLFGGKGMRIDGVSKNRPAWKAGILKGDIIIKMGPVDVIDIMSYMEALGKFRKGDITTVVVLRGNERIPMKVRF